MTTTGKILVGVAVVGVGGGLAWWLLVRSRPECSDSSQCPPGSVCWRGRCLERGAGTVDYAGPGAILGNALDTFQRWLDGWGIRSTVGGAPTDGPITSPHQV